MRLVASVILLQTPTMYADHINEIYFNIYCKYVDLQLLKAPLCFTVWTLGGQILIRIFIHPYPKHCTLVVAFRSRFHTVIEKHLTIFSFPNNDVLRFA